MSNFETFKDYYDLYTGLGFKALRLSGYSSLNQVPESQPMYRYRRAKQSITKGYTDPNYKGLTYEDCRGWMIENGWIGWTIPKGFIALDVDYDPEKDRDNPEKDPEIISRVYKFVRERNLTCFVHKTTNGYHFIFRLTSNDLTADTRAETSLGVITLKVGIKSYLVLAPTPNREWLSDPKITLDELDELPEELRPITPIKETSDNKPDSSERPTEETEKSKATLRDVSKAAEALEMLGEWRVDNYHPWKDVGMSLRSLGDWGLALWDTWSKKSTTKYEKGACSEKWGSFKTEGDNLITLGSLFYWARQDSDREDNLDILDMPDSERFEVIDGKELFKVTTIADIHRFEPPTFLVKDFLIKNSNNIVFGEEESCKSLIVGELARALSTGTPFLNHFQVMEKSKVLIVDEENPKSYLKKLAVGLSLEEDNANLIHLHHGGVKLDNTELRKKLLSTLSHYGIEVVIFNSLSRMHSKKENTDEMNLIGDICNKLVQKGYTVITIHHKNRKGEIRGFSDIPAAIDASFEFVYDKDMRLLSVIPNKTRLDDSIEPFNVKIHRNENDTLMFIVDETVGGVQQQTFEDRKEKELAGNVSAMLCMEYRDGITKGNFVTLLQAMYEMSRRKAEVFIFKYLNKEWTKTEKGSSDIYKSTMEFLEKDNKEERKEAA